MEQISVERKKQLSNDLWIIVLISFIVLGILVIFGSEISQFTSDQSVNIVLRVLVMGIIQFGVAGLGITIVSILRKDSFLNHGLNKKNLLPALLLSLGCCIPALIYQLCVEDVQKWVPFISVKTTSEVLSSGFPWNVIGIIITAICWGFFESFNYVVIYDKISELSPSKYKYLDWGALICAVMCILIHGAVGVTPDAIIQMLVIMFVIYGMLIVRKITGSAWGCILIFFVYWNAL